MSETSTEYVVTSTPAEVLQDAWDELVINNPSGAFVVFSRVRFHLTRIDEAINSILPPREEEKLP